MLVIIRLHLGAGEDPVTYVAAKLARFRLGGCSKKTLKENLASESPVSALT